MRVKAMFTGFFLLIGGAGIGARGSTSVTLAWDPSPDQVQGYAIWYGVSGAGQTNVVYVGSVTNAVVQGIDPARYYFFFATAYDDATNHSAASETITYPGNTPPTLQPIPNMTADEGKTLQFTISASDSDVPAQALRFSLGSNTPAGASIGVTNGAFAWTPTSTQAPSTNQITILVSDNGNPAKSVSQTFSVIVRAGFFLTMNSGNGGSAQVNPKGTLNSAGTKYINGSQVTAQAQAAVGYGFDHWTLNGSSYTANPFTFTMDRAQTLTPAFKLLGVFAQGASSSSPSSSARSTDSSNSSSTSAFTTSQPAASSPGLAAMTSEISTNAANALVLEASTNLVEWSEIAIAPVTDTNVVYRIKTVSLQTQ